ncbi:MAG TPA: VTT domain-containing protein, partial [Terriglobales bacterium]|nr:VTT domain-containing protein [Terriglobales bacterium]
MKKLLAATGLASMVAVLWWTDLLSTLAEPAAIEQTVAAAGMWGPLLYIALAVGLFAVFLLAPPVWASAALWPWPIAFAYSYVASVLASVLTYELVRLFARDWARARVPAKIQSWEQRLEARPVLTVLALRLMLWANPMVDMLAAVSTIPRRSYLIATLAGLLLPTALHVALGAGGIAAAATAPWWLWIIVGA